MHSSSEVAAVGGPVFGASKTATTLTPVEWGDNARIPGGCAAVLDALKFTCVSAKRLCTLNDEQWEQALRFCDESRLTLLVGNKFGEQLPPWVAERIRHDHAGNAIRLEQLKQEYLGIARSFAARAVRHVVLKGFSHDGGFVSEPGLRPQYDLDLWCAQGQLAQARRTLEELGFVTVAEQRRFPTDHLPPMVRKTGWEWRGDYFDPDMPPVVELHFRLWDEATERFAVPGLGEFWNRRQRRPFAGEMIAVLHPADQFAYAALHLLRHLLRGDLRALHVYELAYFLHERREDTAFWNEWQRLHEPKLRQLQTLTCGLAQAWFACCLPATVAEEIRALPKGIQTWLACYAACGIESRFRPAKDELWLHLELLSSARDQLAVLRRRIIPLSLPGRVESAFVPEQQRSVEGTLRGAMQYGLAIVGRTLYHARAFGSVLASAVRWRRQKRALGSRGG